MSDNGVSRYRVVTVLLKYRNFLQTSNLKEPVIETLSSKVVEELFRNGSSIKLFNRVWKVLETDELRERLMKKVTFHIPPFSE